MALKVGIAGLPKVGKFTNSCLLMAFFMMSSTIVMAQQISADEAKSKAHSFLFSGNQRRVQGTAPSLTLAYTAKKGNEVQFYVFNKGDDKGFIIMGGDERANEVLGYSNSGSFDIDKIPENMKDLLGDYQEDIHYAIENNLQPTSAAPSKVRKASAVTKVDIPELIKTKWNQQEPYNNAIPVPSNGVKLYTGCTATATAQVMKFWNYPTKGIGSHSFSMKPTLPDNTEGSEEVIFSADYGNTTYKWESMLNEYTNNYGWVNGAWTATPAYTEEQGNAVATLMYHVGVMADMNYGAYGSSGSSGNIFKMAEGLTNYFGYANSSIYLIRKNYTDEEWENLIYNELASGRPILYSGKSSASGHAFVCHGYSASDNKYAINWGWGGSYDGYFALTGTNALAPKGTGAGGGSDTSGYVIGQSAIIGISPTEVQPLEDVFTLSIYDISENDNIFVANSQNEKITKATTGERVKLSNADFTHLYLFRSMDVSICMKLINVISGKTYYTGSHDVTLDCYGTYYYPYCKLPSAWEMEGGTYRVCPVYKLKGTNEWLEFKLTGNVVLPTIEIERVVRPVAECSKLQFNKYTTTETTYTTSYNKKFYVDTGFHTANDYRANTDFSVGFKFQNGEDVYYCSSETFNLEGVGWSYSSYALTADPSCVLKNGTYTLTPVCKGVDDTDWMPMTLLDGVTPLTVTVTGRTNEEPTPEPEVDNSVVHTDATIPSASKALTVSSSEGTDGEGTEDVDKLFDSTPSTKWCKNFSKTWSKPYVIMNMGKKVYLTHYKLTEGNDTYQFPNRNWSTWTVYGSNDKSSWTEISKESDATTTLFRKTTDKTNVQNSSIYSVKTTTTAYQYFKIEVNSVVGTESGNYVMQMADLYLYGKEYVEPATERVHVDATIPSTSTLLSVSSTSGSGGESGEDHSCLFNGKANSSDKWCKVFGSTWSEPYAIADMGKKVYLTHYKLTEGGDTWQYPTRNWSTWTIYGSDDQLSWTEISKESDAKTTLFRLSTDKTTTPKTSTYSVQTTSTAYRYFKVVVNSIVGKQANGNYVMQMSEMALYGEEYVEPEPDPEPEPDVEHVHKNAEITSSKVKISKYWNSFVESGTETLDKLIDDIPATKWCKVCGGWPLTFSTGEVFYPYFQIGLENAVYLTQYSLTEGADTYKYPNRNWATWEVYGSNDWEDDDSWELISKEDNPKETHFRLSTDKTQTQYTSVYEVQNQTKAYKYYMFMIESLAGDGSLSGDGQYVMQMADLKLYGSTTKPSDNKGDVNGDGSITKADVTKLCEMVLKQQTSVAADINCDGKVDILDITHLISKLKENR